MAGSLVLAEAKRWNATLLPVDSEHSAIFQCLNGEPAHAVRRLILTASGGPFYRYKKPLKDVTPEQALKHPTWKMGRKITIDSATLMNKGLDRKSTRLNSSHTVSSYAVFCLKKKKN